MHLTQLLSCARTARRTSTGVALATLLAAAAAPAADADSIAYIKDGNVKLSSPDGNTIVPVTTSGGFSSVSQADDGKLVALRGTRFVVLDRWGTELADFSPVGSGTAGSITLSGPFDPAISPDGTKIAYGFYVQYKTGDPNCGKPGGCLAGHQFTGTGYTRASGATEWGEAGFRPQYSWTDPSWIDNERTLMAGPSSAFVTATAIDTAGDGADATGWFTDNAVGNFFDGEMNRQQTGVAYVGNSNGDTLAVYRTQGAAPALPERCLSAPAQGAAWSSPSWSPSGEQLAWAGKAGIYVASLAGIANACPDAAGVKVEAFEPGAKSPDWGPAGLPGPKPHVVIPGPTPNPDGPHDPNQPTDTRPVTIDKVNKSRALRKGFTIRVRCSSGKVNATASVAGKTAGRGSAKCRQGGATVKLTLNAAGRRAVRAKRHPVVTVKVNGIGKAAVTL